MEIINAKELEMSIHNKLKEDKYEEMLSIQMKKIEENMKNGRKYVVWIFSDKEYYHNNMEKKWSHEFEERAREVFENAGYKVEEIVIRW